MKKKLAVILSIMLCATVLFGCSTDELGYLKMAGDISKIESCDVSGDVELYYDPQGVVDYIAKNLPKDFENPAELKQEMNQFIKDNGLTKKKINLSYQGSMDRSDNDIKYFLDMQASIDGQKSDLGKFYMSMTEGYYIERDFLINIYKLSQHLIGDDKKTYFYSEEYEKGLREALGTAEYIQIVSAEEMSLAMGGEEMASALSMTDGYNDIYDKTIEFLADMFRNYTTGAVKSTANGYQISVNGDQVMDMISEVLEYVANNVDVIAETVQTYMEAITEVMQVSGAIPEEALAGGAMPDYKLTTEEKSVIAGSVFGLKTQFDAMRKTGVLDSVKPLYYEEKVTKNGDSYSGNSMFGLREGNSDLAYIKSVSTVTPKKTAIDFPTSGTPMLEVIKSVEGLEDKYNPVTSATLSWMKYNANTPEDELDWYGKDMCDIIYEKKGDSLLSNKYEYSGFEYRNINKQMYAPLREICEAFGEEVGWDNKAKQAYVVRDGKHIDMDGVLDGKTVFVKVRDFEKLGYTVVYDGSNKDFHEVTLEKK